MPNLIPPARGTKILRSLSYFFTGLIGIVIMAVLPIQSGTVAALNGSSGGYLGTILTVVWASFILTAYPAAIITYLERYRIEFVLLPFFVSALAVAVVAAWMRVPAEMDLLLIARVTASTALMLAYSARWWELWSIIKLTKGAGGRPSTK